MLSSREFPKTHPSLLAALGSDHQSSHWLEFYRCYAPAVFRVARYRGLAQPDAEDIVQQTMMAIFRHISSFNYSRDRGSFRNWVRRIAECRIVDLSRRVAVTVPLDAVDAPLDDRPDLGERWEQEWKVQDLLYCLEQSRNDVTPRTFEAFRLYALEGVSANETAARLEMSVSQVYVVRSEMLRRVRKVMLKLEFDREEHGQGE